MGPAPHPSPLGDARSPGVADGLRSRTLLQFPGGPAGARPAAALGGDLLSQGGG